MASKVEKSEQEWREALTPEQYRILRKAGTEKPFTGAYNQFKKAGIYRCAGCGLELFDASTKFNSGSGWPSFWAPLDEANTLVRADTSHGMRRSEVLCSRCGGHLGHVFEDGPRPTGLRYCINSASLDFREQGSGES